MSTTHVSKNIVHILPNLILFMVLTYLIYLCLSIHPFIYPSNLNLNLNLNRTPEIYVYCKF